MARFIKDRTKAKGKAPGALVLIGNQKMDQPIIQVMQYNTDSIFEMEFDNIQEALSSRKPGFVNWINIYGIHDLQLIQDLGDTLDIPPLLLEDMVNTDQLPKYENIENHDIFIVKMLNQDGQDNRIHAEQITLILGDGYLITLQERVGDFFAPVRNRIRKSKGKIRLNDNDYLTYALLDIITDIYTQIVEDLGRKIEELEDRIFQKRDSKVVEEIYEYKIELNYLRKTIRPVKELMIQLIKSENTFFNEKNNEYLRDLYDLVIQSTDAIELYNNLVSDQLNIYHSNVSNGTNEVMKVLTIFASIFIPLTFIAGIYGMNFEYFPELKFKYSYAIFWFVVIVVSGSLLYYFKRKKWL
jgi:magnesium transporter